MQITPPDDNIVCVVDGYVYITHGDNGVAHVYLKAPTYIYTLTEDGYVISEPSSIQFSSQRFVDAVDRIKRFYRKFSCCAYFRR